MNERRRQLWIAMSNLWLDTALSESDVRDIAATVRESGLSREELEVVFCDELAPFLGPNLLSPAGVWQGFDPDWVCNEAAKRYSRRCFWDHLLRSSGLMTHAARPAWNRVLSAAFESERYKHDA